MIIGKNKPFPGIQSYRARGRAHDQASVKCDGYHGVHHSRCFKSLRHLSWLVATLDQTNGIWPDPGLLKQLKDSRIVLLQDSRDPYALEAKNLPVIIRTMESGDIAERCPA
jgi:hypothetical protein